MTCRLHRKVVGYPFYQYAAGSGAVAAGATAVFSISDGPGEILGFALFKWAGNIADYNMLNVKIEIDGVTIYDNYLTWLLGSDMNYAFHSMNSTNDIQTAAFNCCSFKLMMAYESTAVITFKNQSANSLSIAFGIHTRQGA